MKTIPHTLRPYTSALLFISCCIFLLTSCDREPYVRCQSDPTCEYFRCKVNGKWWTPDCEQGPLFGCDHTDLQYYRYIEGGGVSLYSSYKREDGIILILSNIKEIGVSYSYVRANRIYSKYLNKNKLSFYVDTTKYNEFILTGLDTVNYMMSARFAFTGVDENGNTVSITDGEFRQHYRF